MNETHNIEYKESWKDEYLKWICGFANAQGGKLYIGIRDDGSVCGVRNMKKLMEDIPNKVRDILGIMVDVNAEKRNGMDVLVVSVEPSSYPVNYRGEYHYRSGATKQLLRGAQLTGFLMKKTGYRWDGEAVSGYKIKDFDRESFEIFRQEALRHNRMTAKDLEVSDLELLKKLNLLTDDGSFTRAAVMTFHRHPERVATGCYTKIGFFENDATLLYQDEIHGSLLYQAVHVLDLLFTKYLRAKITYEDITRVETYPYPRMAIREALFNALVHNNFSRGTPIQISVYDDKLYIADDVSYLEDWTPEKLMTKHKSIQPNPSIANVFFRCGFIEAWGRGIEQICRECDLTGNRYPVFDISSCGFMVRFDALESALIKQGTAQVSDQVVRRSDQVRDQAELTKNLTKTGGNNVGIPSQSEGKSDGNHKGKQKNIYQTTSEQQKLRDKLREKLRDTQGKLRDKLIDRRTAILQNMYNFPKITIADLSKQVNVSQTAINKHIAWLKENGFLIRQGSDRQGRWIVLKGNDPADQEPDPKS